MPAIDYSLLTIEMLTAFLGIAVLILGLIVPSNASKHGFGWLSLLGLAGILGVTVSMWGTQSSLLGGMFIVDGYALFFKATFILAAMLVILGSMRYVDNMGNQSEYYSMLIMVTLGMMIMASAGDFITMYVGLELMTITFVLLVAFKRTNGKSVEAAIKYLLLAGMSSAVMLYGMSLIYGLTGTIVIGEIARIVAAQPVSPALVLAIVLLVAGLGFKISAVPFHMWAPDVYHGAPTPITSFLAMGSKAASFAILMRVFIGALPGAWEQWVLIIAVLAAVSILIGNLVAIPQTNIKRMLAYSGIAQAGYILVGLVAANEAGVKGVMFYSFIYVFATVAAFTVIAYFYNKTGSDELKDYAGLSQRSPLMAAVLVVAMLSMAGIPPLAGFVGKFYLFMAIVDTHLWLVILGLVMSMVSVYYYLNVALVMYRDQPIDPTPINLPGSVTITLIVTMAVTIFLGIYPAPLSEVVNSAAQSFFLH